MPITDIKLNDNEEERSVAAGGIFSWGGGANFQILGVVKTNFGSHTPKAFIT